MASILVFDNPRRSPKRVFFNRAELSLLMGLYSTRVASGEWRDYAIDHTPGVAVFSVFRRAFDKPLFSIAKYSGGPRPADYALFSDNARLKRAAALGDVLDYLQRKPRLIE